MCLVTHSSTAAVEAVIAGVPVFCEPTCAAAPVGRTDLDIENPVRPEREAWLAALAWRQFSRDEVSSGAGLDARERDSMMQCRGIWLPDGEEHLIPHIEKGPLVDGKGTYQLHKLEMALAHVRKFRRAVDAGLM